MPTSFCWKVLKTFTWCFSPTTTLCTCWELQGMYITLTSTEQQTDRHMVRVSCSPLKVCNCEAYLVPFLEPPWNWFLVTHGANLLGNTQLVGFPLFVASLPHFPTGPCWDNLSNLLLSQILLSFQFCGILNKDQLLCFNICWGYLNVTLLLLSSYPTKLRFLSLVTELPKVSPCQPAVLVFKFNS